MCNVLENKTCIFKAVYLATSASKWPKKRIVLLQIVLPQSLVKGSDYCVRKQLGWITLLLKRLIYCSKLLTTNKGS